MKNFHSIKIILIVFLINIIEPKFIVAQDSWTVTTLDNPAPGYLRFDWPNPPNFFLVDNYGLKQYMDTVNHISSSFYKPLSNGLWITLTPIGNPAKYLLFDQFMNLKDSIPMPASYQPNSHDVALLNNGHYLLICVQDSIMDLSKIVQGGQTNADVIADVLIETDRTGAIYWVWKTLDYLNITDALHYESLIQPTVDFTHANSVVEDSIGNILFSLNNLDEVTKINKATKQIIWRMGGSMSKSNQFTFVNDTDSQGFFGFAHQHSISITPNGNLLMYDNGTGKELLNQHNYSRAVEYKIDEKNKTVNKVWEYRNTPDIFQFVQGSVQRLPNGNTLINWAGYKITEVKPDKSIAFELKYDSTQHIYRAWRIVTRMNAVSQYINAPGEYNYNDSVYTTGVTVSVSAVTGKGYTAIEKHNYAPPTGNYEGKDITAILPFRWVFSQSGISGINGTFKIKANTVVNLGEPTLIRIYKRDKESVGIFKELNTSYDAVSGNISVNISGFGEFAMAVKIDSALVQINYPNGGDTLVKDSIPKIIKWNQNFDGLIKIELLKNDLVVNLIKDSLYASSGSGTFSWLIASNIIADSVYKIRITSETDSTVSKISMNNFTISEVLNVNEIAPSNNAIEIKNYPNPFDKTTTFEFYIANAGTASINLFNMQGEKLETIYNKYLEPGRYNITWDSGEITPGVYFYKITNDINYKFGKLLIY